MNETKNISHLPAEINHQREISIDGNVLFVPDQSTLTQLNIKINQPYFVEQNQLARHLAELLANPTAFIKEFQPLSTQDATEAGIRSLKGTLHSYPEVIIVLSGLGVVKKNSKDQFTVEPPHWKESVFDYEPMAHNEIASDGSIWRKSNRTVFGASNLERLKDKVNKTATFSPLVNTHDSSAQALNILLVGSHKGHPDYGYFAYSLPKESLETITAINLDLMKRSSLEEPGLYGAFIANLFSKIKTLHSNNAVHLELHPGNCFARLKANGSITAILTDWSTVQDTNNLPSPGELKQKGFAPSESDWFNLRPEQVARAVDLHIALENVFVSPNKSFRILGNNKKEYGVDLDPYFLTSNEVSLRLTFYAVAVLAYQDQATTPEKIASVKAVLQEVINTIIIPNICKADSFSRSEWENSGGNLDRMERPEYFFHTVFIDLSTRLSAFLASDLAGREKPFTFESFTSIKVAEYQEYTATDKEIALAILDEQNKKFGPWAKLKHKLKQMLGG